MTSPASTADSSITEPFTGQGVTDQGWQTIQQHPQAVPEDYNLQPTPGVRQNSIGHPNSLVHPNPIVHSGRVVHPGPVTNHSNSNDSRASSSGGSSSRGNSIGGGGCSGSTIGNSNQHNQSTRNSLSLDQQPMVVNASGPMSSNVVVPQRPRPGRKPIPQEDAADRRRMQNRIAQRNFRDKRQQKLAETLQELDQNKHKYRDEISHLEQGLRQQMKAAAEKAAEQLASATRRAEAAERRAAAAEQRVVELERQLQASQNAAMAASISTPFRSMSGALVPPHGSRARATPRTEVNTVETDFTNFGRPKRTITIDYGTHATSANDSVTSMDYSMDVDGEQDRCGFCTDDQNCACKPAAKPEPPTMANMTGPGSCDMCRADPKRAQACRDMASMASLSPRSTVSPPSQPFQEATTARPPKPSLPSLSMPPPPRMSCSAMIDEFHRFGARTSSIASLLNGVQLNTYPAANGGYELEEQQAAEVLSTLARRSSGPDASPVDEKYPGLGRTDSFKTSQEH